MEIKPMLFLVVVVNLAIANSGLALAQQSWPGFIYTRARGRCTPQYWSSRTDLWPKMIHPESALSNIFGSRVFELRFKNDTTLLEAISATKDDVEGSENNAYSTLVKESAAALINSYARKGYPYTAWEVKTLVITALVSDKAADSQARKFLRANQNCG